MNESRHINIDAIIKQAGVNKGDLLNRQEVPPDIDKHPIDEIDLLVLTCTEKNCQEVIKKIKDVFKNNPEEIEKLTEELFIQIGDQTNIAKSEEKKCDNIQDMETRILTKSKWINKRKALVILSKTFDRRSEERDETEEE